MASPVSGAELELHRPPSPPAAPARNLSLYLLISAAAGAVLMFAAVATLTGLEPAGTARTAAVFATVLGFSLFAGGVLAVAAMPLRTEARRG